MALTTTPKGSDSDSYVTLAEWQTYVLNFIGEDVTQHGHDTAHEQNLRRAAQYIDRQYTFDGYPTDNDQALQFPRVTSKIVDGREVSSSVVPQRIKDAQCELAFLIHEGLDPFATVTNGAVRRSMAKAGPVESETEYDNARETPRLVAIEGSLKPFLAGGGAGRVRIERA